MSSTPSRIVIRTIYSAELQTAKFLNIPYAVRNNTTLNQKLDIQANAVPDLGVKPSMKYLAIGNRGHRVQVGGDGFSFISPVSHRPSDSSLYGQIPWVIRPVTQDLPADQRAKFALRRTENIEGDDYYVYYLKRLDYTDVTTGLFLTTIRDGDITTVPFIPNNSNLNPTQPEIPPNGATSTLEQGDYLTAKALLRINLTPSDVSELINVATILYGDENYAIISEFGLCSGIDKTINVLSTGGANISFVESIHTQISSFISTYHQLSFANNGLEFTVDVGANEGLLTDVVAS